SNDPPADGFSVGGRLGLKEPPGNLILLQQSVVRLRQVDAALLIGIDARFVFFPGFKGTEAGWPHQASLDERLRTPDVDAAPDAAGFARREANGVAGRIDALPNAVDPAIAKCFVNRLGPSNACFARSGFMIADQQCNSAGMMPLKP